jgi:hypothetical protein
VTGAAYSTPWRMAVFGTATRRVLLDRKTGRTVLVPFTSTVDWWAFDQRAALALRVTQAMPAANAMRFHD